jgi:ABC-type multidrug transport system ATPase subunit
MGFQFADSGEIRVLGYDPGDVRAKQQIGFLPENFAFTLANSWSTIWRWRKGRVKSAR